MSGPGVCTGNIALQKRLRHRTEAGEGRQHIASLVKRLRLFLCPPCPHPPPPRLRRVGRRSAAPATASAAGSCESPHRGAEAVSAGQACAARWRCGGHGTRTLGTARHLCHGVRHPLKRAFETHTNGAQRFPCHHTNSPSRS